MRQATTLNGGWQYVILQQTIPACRKGWAGAWDAFKAAFMGSDRLTVPKAVTISLTISGPPGCEVGCTIGNVNIEEKKQ